MKNTVDILNNSRENLVIIRYTVDPKKVITPDEINFLKSNIPDFFDVIGISASIVAVAIDFGFGSYALVNDLKTLVPDNIVIAKIPFKHFLSFEQFPKFEKCTGDGNFSVIYPDCKAEIAFAHAWIDIQNM